MTLFASLLILSALHSPLPRPAAALPADSIGQEMRGGQRMVRHRVVQGETIFGLARHYKIKPDQLVAANPQLKNGLGIGEIVLVPRPGGAGPAKAATAPLGPSAAGTATRAAVAAAGASAAPARYTVAKGETLFGIARRYSLSPASLIELNKLPAGGQVRVGQELLLRAAEIGAAPATVASVPSRSAPPAPIAASSHVQIDTNKEAVIATVTTVPAAPALEKEKIVFKDREGKEKEKDRSETPRNLTRASELAGRKTEDGIGATIDNSGTDKYLALHKTAPVGTIMEVKNMMNGQTVYVRVIGQLPDTGENDNVLVRLSPRAVAKLGTSDAKFRVETSYVP